MHRLPLYNLNLNVSPCQRKALFPVSIPTSSLLSPHKTLNDTALKLGIMGLLYQRSPVSCIPGSSPPVSHPGVRR